MNLKLKMFSRMTEREKKREHMRQTTRREERMNTSYNEVKFVLRIACWSTIADR